MKCVRAWVKEFPSITGQDAFELRKYIDLDYWKEVEKKYEEFINHAEGAKEPIILPVVGEWGVGKTSSFKSILVPLLKKRGYAGVKIKAKNFFNYFQSFMKSGRMNIEEAAIRALIIAVFKTFNIDFNENESTIKLFRKLLNDFNTDKIFIYLDEFEDIVEIENASLILDGLASLVSGEYKPLSVEGEFKGKLHLILSLTPQAYSRMSSEAKETFGRIRRRMKGEVKLAPVSREEAYNFVLGYFKYIYDGVPDELPLASESIIDTLYKASNGNLGYMTQFLNSILSRTKLFECQDGYYPIDAEELVETLGKEKIVEMGIEREVIRIERIERLYERIISKQRETKGEIKKVLYALAISPYPITNEQLVSMTNLNWDYVHFGILKIEYGLTEFRKPVLKFLVVPEDEIKRKLFPDAIEELAKKLGLDKEKVEEDLESVICYLRIFKFSNGSFSRYLAIPVDEIVEEEIAEEIWEKEGKPDKVEIIQILSKLREIIQELNPKIRAYKLSDAILNTIFPPRCIICPASKSIQSGYKIWRETINEISAGEVDPISLGESLIPLIIPEYLTSPTDYQLGVRGIYQKVFTLRDNTWKLRFLAIGILNKTLLWENEFYKAFGSMISSVPLVLLFTKRELARDAERLSKRIREAHIKVIPIGLQEMAILHGLRKLKENGLLREVEARRIILQTREIIKFDINNFVEEIITELDDRGIVLKFPEWPSSGKVLDLPSVYDYYIIYPEARIDREKMFKWVEENVKKKKIFGVRRRDYPCGVDIESAKELESYEDKLRHEGFLKKDVEGFLLISNNKIEKRLLDLIREKEKVPIKYLLGKFIYSARNETEVKEMLNLYLETLKRKGYVEVLGNDTVSFVNISDLEQTARRVYEELLKEYNHLDEGVKFDMLLVAKKRAYNLFSVRQVLETLRELLISANMHKEIDRRRVLKSLIRLSKHFAELYLALVHESYRRSKKLKRTIEGKIEEIEEFIVQLVEYLNELGINVNKDKIEEYQRAKELFKEFNDIWNVPDEISEAFLFKYRILVRKDDLIALDSGFNFERYEKLEIPGENLYILHHFFYSKIENTRKVEGYEKAFFLNPKFFLLQDRAADIERLYNEIRDTLGKVKEYTRRIGKLINEKRMLERAFEEKLGKEIKVIIKQYRVEELTIESEKIKLIELTNQVKRIYDEVKELIKKLEKARRILELIDKNLEQRIKLTETLMRNIEDLNVPKEIMKCYGIESAGEIKEAVERIRILLERLKKMDRVVLEDLINELEEFEKAYKVLPSVEDILSILKDVQRVRDEITRKVSKWVEDLERARKRGLPREEYFALVNELLKIKDAAERRNKIAEQHEKIKLLEEKINSILMEYLNPIAEAIREELEKITGEEDFFRILQETLSRLEKKGLYREKSELVMEILKHLEKLREKRRISIIVRKLGNE